MLLYRLFGRVLLGVVPRCLTPDGEHPPPLVILTPPLAIPPPMGGGGTVTPCDVLQQAMMRWEERKCTCWPGPHKVGSVGDLMK